MATATSAASAREILTGLHDVMASKLGAQAKLNISVFASYDF